MEDQDKNKSRKKPAGKVPSHFSSDDFDYWCEDDSKPSQNEDECPQNSQEPNGSQQSSPAHDNAFRGKLMRMFNEITDAKDLIQHQAHPGLTREDYVPQDYNYIQMKLNIEHISEEFAQELEEYRISGIEVRRATQEDLGIFVKLYNRAFMRGSDPWSPATEAQFQEILDHKTTVVLIASIQGEDVGFIITDLEEDGRVGVICGLGTDPRYQRRGIARYLGIASWDYFQQMDVKELRCEVYENNVPSYKLIKSLHFKEYGMKTYKF